MKINIFARDSDKKFYTISRMELFSYQFWLYLGLLLMFLEFLLPGLVSVFVGLGALTVGLFIHLGYVDGVLQQLVVWFVASSIYIFSLRLLVMKYYPTDTKKENINEDEMTIGQCVEVVATIEPGEPGRVKFGNTTWQASSDDQESILIGEKVRVISRENITWLVTKTNLEIKATD